MGERAEVVYLGRVHRGSQISGPSGRLYHIAPDGQMYLMTNGRPSAKPGVLLRDVAEYRQFPTMFRCPKELPPPPSALPRELDPSMPAEDEDDDEDESSAAVDDEDDESVDPIAPASAPAAALPKHNASKDAWLRFAADNDVPIDVVEQELSKKQVVEIITKRWNDAQRG